METGLTKNQIIATLTKSPHGDLAQYVPIGTAAAEQDAAFFSHLVAWNEKRGVIRDAKVALPVLALTAASVAGDAELRDNALAHIALLDPRNLVRAVRFSKQLPVKARNALHRLVERYLRDREASPGRFDRTALQHRESLKELYALLRIKPGSDRANVILFGRKLDKTKAEPEGVFALLPQLKNMAPEEAAGTIMKKRIPFLVAAGALGAKAKDPAVVQALIGAMTPTELVTNTKMLERLGVKTNPALRAAFEAGLKKVADSGAAVLKTTRAADAVGGSTGEKLRGAQEKQLDRLGVKGDWLVLCDRSGSMSASIEAARHISATLARVAEGSVHLVFYNNSPEYVNVTGKSLDEITALTKRVVAQGGTVPSTALVMAQEKGLQVDGIVMVTDGNENGGVPPFTAAFERYCAFLGKVPPVYAYQLKGDPPNMLETCPRAGVDVHVFDLRGGLDYYSLPNLIQTMRVNRYSLVEEIMETPLLRLADVFTVKKVAEGVPA